MAALILVVLLAAALWWGLSRRAREQPRLPAARVVLGCERSLVTTPVWVAEHEGYFDQSGVTVTIKEFDSGKASLSAMLAGEGLDMCTVAQTPIMFNSFKRKDFDDALLHTK